MGVHRESSAVLPPFLCLSQRRGRHDAQGARHAARIGTPCRASAGTGAEGYGEYRSLAGGENASSRFGGLQPAARAQRRERQRLIWPIAEWVLTIQLSTPTIFRDARFVRSGSIEAIR